MTSDQAVEARIERLRQRDSQSEPDDYWTGWNDALDAAKKTAQPAPAIDVEALARAYRTALAVIEYGEVVITDPVALAEFRRRAAIAAAYAEEVTRD